MESIEEPPLTNTVEEGVKVLNSDEVIMNTEVSKEKDILHPSNGVVELDAVAVDVKSQDMEPVIVQPTVVANDEGEPASKPSEGCDSVTEPMDTEEIIPAETEIRELNFEIVETELPTVKEAESTEVENIDGNTVVETGLFEESVEVDGIVENNAENITFETEIFIETNSEIEEGHTCNEPDSNMLSELGQNIELSEVLRSSDVSETVENNNCDQEVFNKEELLDILEGNDVEESRKIISDHFNEDSKKLEEHLALQQLNKLNISKKKKNRHSPKKPEKKQPKRGLALVVSKESKSKVEDTSSSHSAPLESRVKGNDKNNLLVIPNETKEKIKDTTSSSSIIKEVKGDEKASKKETSTSSKPPRGDEKLNKREISVSSKPPKGDEKLNKKETGVISKPTKGDEKPNKKETSVSSKPPKENEKSNKNVSIVNALVQDWSDDEHMDTEESNTLINESEVLIESTDNLPQAQEAQVQEDQIESHANASETNNEDASLHELNQSSKSGDESQPQRRLGRVIKKKVIFDPDNPDTFTKSKLHIKREKETSDKEQPVQSTPKKPKTDQTPQPPKSKSPVSKMQWKKPQPKSKQSSKRLTEIDRLLMDEGAVNMICQLTPEAMKGNKNMKSKAEFIKNIQSSTPNTKEMKFRERKSKSKSEEGDSKKAGNGKNRLSLSSSVKSPSVSEDFENHSADDSIIYRRHSSSSYSSPCMSPRRLSDFEGVVMTQPPPESQIIAQDKAPVANNLESEVFEPEKTITPKREIMNKSDCLSIKQKLNSKLSQALNKRKLAGVKSEKPPKVKKVMQVEEVSTDISVHFDHKVAEICIGKAGSLFSIKILNVLEKILSLVDSRSDITVTLITSECGTICSGLDLKPILDDVKHALDIAEGARSLMLTLEKHSKLVVMAVEGRTRGFSVAVAALADVLVASENTTFSLSEHSKAVLHPGAVVLTSRVLPQTLLNELIVFGREVPASEALVGGLVTRIVWSERLHEQARAIARDLAAQPYENIMLKKQLLGLKKAGSASTFQTSLEKERDLLATYWTSAEGLELLRTINAHD